MSSPTGEPLPGAVPSEPVPPVPEGEPKKGIRVRVHQPELLHKLSGEISAGTSSFEEINKTEVNDSQFYELSTQLWSWGKTKTSLESVQDTRHFQSWFRPTRDRLRQPDYGYYDPQKLAEMRTALTSRGYEVELKKDFSERNLLVFRRGDDEYTAMMGYSSRQEEEDYIRAEVAREKARGVEGNYSKMYVHDIERGLVNDLYYLDSDGKKVQEGDLDRPAFVRQAEAYAGAYQDFLEVIYKVNDTVPPDKEIILRPPILAEDTLTKIATTETETPIHLVESQVVQEQASFDEIAGQDAAVAEAKRLVLAINHPEVFEKRGVKRPKGILFYGPPGTGKTLIAKAVAAESNAAFLEVSAADIGTKWHGESERLMQKVFDLANDAVSKGTKVVLFFDELDSLAPSREEAHEATRKVVATLLQNMDGMKANPNVTIIAATNRPQDIDPALKRPGRIDKLIQVGLPNAEGRQAILKVHMEKAKKAATAPGELFAEGIDLAQVGQATDGMSGADLANLVNLTLEEKTMAELEGREWTPISTEEMLATAQKLGMVREEKRRIGFFIPERPLQNKTQTTPQAGVGK